MKKNGKIEKFYHYAFPMPAVLLTCSDENGNVNPITLAWVTPISKKPPLYAVSVAPSRYSHDLIKNSGEFVINFAPFDIVEKVNFCGTHSGRKTDKINESNLTLIHAEKVKTKLIKECFAHLECKLFDSFTLGDHTLFVGEVVNTLIDEDAFENDVLNNNSTKPTCYLGGNAYTTIDKTKKKT